MFVFFIIVFYSKQVQSAAQIPTDICCNLLWFCSFQVDLYSSFCVWGLHCWEKNLLTFMPSYLLGQLACSLLKMRCKWPGGGGGQHEMFFLLWDLRHLLWSSRLFSPIILAPSNLCHPVPSSGHFSSSFCHPLQRTKCCIGLWTPSTLFLPIQPSVLTFCFFDYLCFYRTLMAVFNTHCDV